MRRSTFTLIEMLVVICILLILMGLGAAGVNKVLQNNAKKSTKLAVKAVVEACEQYKNRYGAYPTATTAPSTGEVGTNGEATATFKILDFGTSLNDGGGKNFIDPAALEINTLAALQDYWGTPFRYMKLTNSNNEEYGVIVWSLGPDAASSSTTRADNISSSGP